MLSYEVLNLCKTALRSGVRGPLHRLYRSGFGNGVTGMVMFGEFVEAELDGSGEFVDKVGPGGAIMYSAQPVGSCAQK